MRKNGNNIHFYDIKLYKEWLAVTAIFILFAIISFTVTTEDAYISFRYAENIAGGHGAVFNIGERVVEGYSNPTWVALLTIFSIIGVDVIWAGRCLGLLFGALTILEIMLLFRLVDPKKAYQGVMASLAVATAPYYLFWSQTGLENGLFIYLLVLGLRLAVQEEMNPARFPYSGIAYFLLATTRPEGIIYFVIMGAWKLGIIITKNDKNFRRFLLWAAVTIVPFVIFLLWRHHTFGEWVPNTFFAKVNNGIRWNLISGTRYLVGYLNHSLWAPLIIPAAMLIVTKKFGSTAIIRRVLWAALIQTVGLVMFVLYVGGDIHPNDRFGVPIILFSAIVSFMLANIDEPGRWWKRISVWAAAIFIALNFGYSFPPAHGIIPPISRPPNFLAANIAGLAAGRITPGDIISRFASPPVDTLEFVGRDIASNPEIEGLLAAEQCGKIPYFSKLPVIDLLGLNDPEIARIVDSVSSWDLYADEVLKHEPKTWVMVYRNRHLISRYYIENTVLSEAFRARYELDAIYHTEYYFTDIRGIEHMFSLELVRYRAKPGVELSPMTVEELEWCRAHDPMRETPDALADEVEAFRALHENDPEKVIMFRVDLN